MPKKRILPFIILGIINNHPQITGREITAEFSTEIGNFWKASHSQIYPELRRMANDNWILVTTSTHNAKEKYYELTAAGKQVLNEWLDQLVDEVPIHQDLFSLKLFFINNPADNRIKELIGRQIELLSEELTRLHQRKAKVFPTQASINHHYGHYLILTRAISRTAGQIKWLKETQQQLNK